ncbi:MAG: hypothetical protein U0736_14445 [Gemmataceae bacterium]
MRAERQVNGLPPTDRTQVEQHLAARCTHAWGMPPMRIVFVVQILARHPDDRARADAADRGADQPRCGQPGSGADRRGCGGARGRQERCGGVRRSSWITAQASRGERGRLAEARKLIEEMRQLRPVGVPAAAAGAARRPGGSWTRRLACYRR